MQLHLAEFDLNTVARLGGNFPIFREQAQGRVLLVIFVEHLQGFAPGCFLTVVNLPQIQHRPLCRLVGPHPTVLHHAEVAMLLTIFLSNLGAKKHCPRHHARIRPPWKGGRSAPHTALSPVELTANRLWLTQWAIFGESVRYCERRASRLAAHIDSTARSYHSVSSGSGPACVIRCYSLTIPLRDIR